MKARANSQVSLPSAVAAPRDGLYVIDVEGRGTPCRGVFPLARVAVDARTAGWVSSGPDFTRSSVLVELAAGEHEIAVSFENDASTGTEDRNYVLRSVTLGEAAGSARDLVALTTGPTTASLRLGRGRILINLLRWDTEERNATKARRLFGALLTGLGADFRDDLGAAYDITRFAPQPGMPHFRAEGGVAHLAAMGWVEGEIEAPRDGTYRICVDASGTPAKGEYPQFRASVDGVEIGSVKLRAASWRRYSLPAELTAGRHVLRLEFTNDLYEPPEDRNLALGSIVVVPVEQAVPAPPEGR